jgi:hypothetical protein
MHNNPLVSTLLASSLASIVFFMSAACQQASENEDNDSRSIHPGKGL